MTPDLSEMLHAPYHHYVKALERPLWEDACLFEAGVGRNVNGNMFALVRELCKDSAHKGYRVALSVRAEMLDVARERLGAYGLDQVQLVETESREYDEWLARAKYLFNDNTFPAYLTKRAGQVYLNTWHGTPLKRLGLSDIRNSLRSFANVQKNLLTADYLLFPNQYTQDVFMGDYDLAPFFQGAIVLCDYPRNDVFSNGETFARVRRSEGIPEGHQAIAYMPTWRGSGRTADSEGQISEVTAMLRELDAGLGDNQTLFVNLHFTVQGAVEFDGFRHVRPFPTHLETYDFLAACDVLVTDYSSVMFDFAETERPILLFPYDRDEYLAGKGTYFPYDELPFPVATTTGELVRLLGDDLDTSWHGEFTDRWCPAHSGHAAHDVLSLVLDGNAGELSVIRHLPAQLDEALYVYSLGPKRVREAVMPTIKEMVGDDRFLITTASYSEGAIEALEELRGRVHMLIVVRRHVQTVWEKLLFDLASRHRLAARLLEGALRSYFGREARQMLCNVSFRRFRALHPDGSYLMWMVKGTECERVSGDLT